MNIDALVRGNRDIALGRMGSIACAATAADKDQMLVPLVRRPREAFEELLDRLDGVLRKRWDEDVFIDEING